MKFRQKIIISLFGLVLALFVNSSIVNAEDDYKEITSNNRFTMEFNETTANIKITDKNTQTTWTSFPENWEEDSMAKGAIRANLASHLLLDVYGDKDNLTTINSYNQCVKKGLFTTETLKDGLAINYNFESQGIQITIEFHLTENGITVSIPPSKIVETESIIANISILPFFCTGAKGEDGYLFVPDGSGMLVDFKDNFGLYRNLTRPVYGRDYATSVPSSELIEEVYRLPVYGVKNQDKGIFAIIETNEARATITTGIAGFMFNSFRNYSTMSYREQNEISIINNSGLSTKYIRWSDPISSDMIISYYLLDKEHSDYSDMAAIYQQYLIEKKGMSKNVKNPASFDLTLIGAVKMRRTFLGIPYTADVPLTTFKQAEKIISALKNRGIENINVRYLGYNNNGYLSQWTENINPLFSLGGKSGLKKFIDFSKDNNANVFLSGELIQVYKSGNGFSVSKNAVRTISNSILQVFDYSIVTGNLLNGVNPRYLVTPNVFSSVFTNFINDVKSYSLKNIAFEDVGSMIYSDYNKKNKITRDESQKLIEEAVKLPEDFEYAMFTGGNAYIFDQATHMIEVPLTDSKNQISSRQVPFYQMVIHGYINYSGNPFNLSNNHKKDFLKMIEYGANIHYYGIYEESSILKNSKINYILSSCYEDWISEASDMYRKIYVAYNSIYNKRMIDHFELEDGVYVTVYEGGINIVVNYNEDSFRVNNDVVVKGMDFMIVEGDIYEN